MADDISVLSSANMAWETVAGGMVRQKAAINDRSSGEFLGLLALEPLARTGVHKHLDIAFSYHLAGSSINYTNTVHAGQLGITLAGTVHETVTYGAALAVVRTEGPTMFPSDSTVEHMHAGAVSGDMSVAAPEDVGSCRVIDAGALPFFPTMTPGLSRRMVFDYSATPKDRRLVELMMLPGTRVPEHIVRERTEWFVFAGDIEINGKFAGPTDFVVFDAGAKATLASRYGARVLAWANGRMSWCDDPKRADLYGFA